MKKAIPSFDIYKTLGVDVSLIIQRLEKSYHEYDSNQAHRHNYFEIIFFEKSGGEHEIDFVQYPLTANSVHLISPEQVHVLRRQKNVTGYVLAFSEDLFFAMSQNRIIADELLFFETLNNFPIIKFSLGSARQFIKVIHQIEMEYKSGEENKELMCCALVCQLLIFLKRHHSKHESANNGNRLTNEFKKLVKQHFLKLSSVSEYANLLHITAGHLNDSVKQATGKNAKAIIQEQLTLEAKRLLYHSEQTIKEIAFHLNFEDASHFTRFFKKASGYTPIDFRTNIREKYH